MTAARTLPAPGDIRTWDNQADGFGGQYRLLDDLGAGSWLAENLAPSDAVVDAILECAAYAEAHGHSYLGTIDEVEAEVARREADAGRTFKVRLVSRDAYDAHF
jgi:hypothetical protein